MGNLASSRPWHKRSILPVQTERESHFYLSGKAVALNVKKPTCSTKKQYPNEGNSCPNVKNTA